MKKCPYCGRDNEDCATKCVHCFGSIPQKQETNDGEPVAELSKRKRISKESKE